MLETIITGRKPEPPRLVLYGMEGIGKSTFGAGFPNAIFVQTEDGLGNIDCSRFPLCERWEEVARQLAALKDETHEFRTVVVDSVDWLERLIWDRVCRDQKVDSIEAIGYGRGYTHALTYWRQFLTALDALRREKKMIVLLLAHAIAEDYADPEVQGIKRFTPRLHKTARSLIAEYVDLILLATRQFGAANGELNNPRVVKTEPSPYQVAKSRYSIPAVLPLDASAVLNSIQNSLKEPQNENQL